MVIVVVAGGASKHPKLAQEERHRRTVNGVHLKKFALAIRSKRWFLGCEIRVLAACGHVCEFRQPKALFLANLIQGASAGHIR